MNPCEKHEKEVFMESGSGFDCYLCKLDKLSGELRIKSEFLSSRQCPDHSGKWERGRCLQCELETLQNLHDDLLIQRSEEQEAAYKVLSRLHSANAALGCIAGTPPVSLEAANGMSAEWWIKLVADMRTQATEAQERVVEKQSPEEPEAL